MPSRTRTHRRRHTSIPLEPLQSSGVLTPTRLWPASLVSSQALDLTVRYSNQQSPLMRTRSVMHFLADQCHWMIVLLLSLSWPYIPHGNYHHRCTGRVQSRYPKASSGSVAEHSPKITHSRQDICFQPRRSRYRLSTGKIPKLGNILEKEYQRY